MGVVRGNEERKSENKKGRKSEKENVKISQTQKNVGGKFFKTRNGNRYFCFVQRIVDRLFIKN